jgi:ABC-type dipeptide/oligopeptide/nickel transport system permease subunit
MSGGASVESSLLGGPGGMGGAGGTGASPVASADSLVTAKPANLWRDTLANVFRQRSAIIGAVILAFFVVIGVFAGPSVSTTADGIVDTWPADGIVTGPHIAPFDPTLPLLGVPGQEGLKGTSRAAPCLHAFGCPADKPEHLFGVDGNFRDLFSRVVYGTRVSVPSGFFAIGLAIIIGTLIGAVAGYLGGKVDNVLMRIMDVGLAFPSFLLAIIITVALGRTLQNALLAVGIVGIPIYARIVRASVLSIRENEFVTASKALGESGFGILMRRVMPNSLTPLIVQGTLGIGGAVLEIAGLAFIGVTGDISVPEWGSMISLERGQLFTAPHVVLIPGLAITLTVLGFNLLGDGLRDALDPRLNR